MLLDRAVDEHVKAHLEAISCPKSGAWLHALPIAPLGLRVSDDVVRVAVGLHLCVPICRPHLCASCGADVEVLGAHELSCRFNKARHSRFASVNDMVKWSLESVKIPCHLKPSGLFRSDGKRPDGALIVSWKEGEGTSMGVTCPDTLVPSHSRMAVMEAGTVVNDAGFKKRQKYAYFTSSHYFVYTDCS